MATDIHLAIYFSMGIALVVVVATLLSQLVQISPRAKSAIQHLTAGIVMAAAATEIIPTLTKTGVDPVEVVAGFSLGVGLMLSLRYIGETFLEGSSLGGIVAAGVDLLIDGFLLALAFVVGIKSGIILASAFTVGAFFLTLGLMTTLSSQSSSVKWGAGLILAMAIPLGAAAGVDLAGRLTEGLLIPFFAFGAAALLYLAVEELLTKAHAHEDSYIATALFFVGFLFPLIA